jgi:hypothetical protein
VDYLFVVAGLTLPLQAKEQKWLRQLFCRSHFCNLQGFVLEELDYFAVEAFAEGNSDRNRRIAL